MYYVHRIEAAAQEVDGEMWNAYEVAQRWFEHEIAERVLQGQRLHSWQMSAPHNSRQRFTTNSESRISRSDLYKTDSWDTSKGSQVVDPYPYVVHIMAVFEDAPPPPPPTSPPIPKPGAPYDERGVDLSGGDQDFGD